MPGSPRPRRGRRSRGRNPSTRPIDTPASPSKSLRSPGPGRPISPCHPPRPAGSRPSPPPPRPPATRLLPRSRPPRGWVVTSPQGRPPRLRRARSRGRPRFDSPAAYEPAPASPFASPDQESGIAWLSRIRPAPQLDPSIRPLERPRPAPSIHPEPGQRPATTDNDPASAERPAAGNLSALVEAWEFPLVPEEEDRPLPPAKRSKTRTRSPSHPRRPWPGAASDTVLSRIAPTGRHSRSKAPPRRRSPPSSCRSAGTRKSRSRSRRHRTRSRPRPRNRRSRAPRRPSIAGSSLRTKGMPGIRSGSWSRPIGSRSIRPGTASIRSR